MYRLLILADDGICRTLLTIGGERKSIDKDMRNPMSGEKPLEWRHSKNERLAMALFKGIMAKHEAEQEVTS